MPNVIIPDKICPHCGGNKWRVRNRKGYNEYECNVKRNEERARYRKKYPERRAAAQRRYFVKNRREILDKNIRWARANPDKKRTLNRRGYLIFYNSDKGKKYYKERDRRYVMSLFDPYIKKLLTQSSILKHSDIPQNLVNIKRKQLKLYRHAKEIASSTNSGNR